MKEETLENITCSHGGDMLAYLYNEMAMVDRDSFEVHLADCGPCIDDFAVLSQSRYPVYDWKRSEFDPLPTPRVVIPFEAQSQSWFDQIRTAVSFRPTLAFGGLGAAMILAVLTGYFILGGLSGDTEEVAREVEPAASPARVALVPSPSPSSELPVKNVISTDEPKPVKAAAATKRTIRSAKSKPVQPAKQNVPIPVMSSIDDDEDDSLRLADIFEEIETSE